MSYIDQDKVEDHALSKMRFLGVKEPFSGVLTAPNTGGWRTGGPLFSGFPTGGPSNWRTAKD